MVLTTPTEAGRRFNFPSESLKIPSDQIRLMVEAATQKIPIPVANAMMATVWFLSVDEFRKLEEKFIDCGQYEQSFQDHRAMLSNLIADGEAIILAATKNGIGDTPGNFTVEDMKATLDSLHTAFYCEHEPTNSAKMNKLIEGLFNEQKS